MNEGFVFSHLNSWQVCGLIHSRELDDRFNCIDLETKLIRQQMIRPNINYHLVSTTKYLHYLCSLGFLIFLPYTLILVNGNFHEIELGD